MTFMQPSVERNKQLTAKKQLEAVEQVQRQFIIKERAECVDQTSKTAGAER